MKAKKFGQENVVYAKDTPYETPAYRDNSPKGDKDVVICYGLNFWERLMVLMTGNIWVTIKTIDGNIRPMRASTLKKDMITTRKQRKVIEKKLRKPRKLAPMIPPPGESPMMKV